MKEILISVWFIFGAVAWLLSVKKGSLKLHLSDYIMLPYFMVVGFVAFAIFVYLDTND